MEKSKFIAFFLFLLCTLPSVMLFSSDDEEEIGVDLFSLLKFENGQCLEMELIADFNIAERGTYLDDGKFEFVLESTILSLDDDGKPDEYKFDPKSALHKTPGSERVDSTSFKNRDSIRTVKFEDGSWNTYQESGEHTNDGPLYICALPQSPELRALLPKKVVTPGEPWDFDFKAIEAYVKSLLKDELDFEKGTNFYPKKWKGSGKFIGIQNGIATLKLNAEGSVQIEGLPYPLHISCVANLEIDTQKGHLKTVTGSFTGFVGENELGLQKAMFGIDCKVTINFKLLKK